ncbi:hypothetical protein LG296_20155 (plasmid) [Ureibacillus chungkukjangi]|uniref:hypothetical protein n=1 Tax=Ureibacillus chungkukjangi TaxID=1202712 RepID=UPI000D357BA8|nr:hypothetical protein [Ureibacillus chungkukjangi]MCM3390640.1 hypothetical protein [Ureibacillus chungkukjangi]HCG4535968.1 hypothetical protein [Salmonella enterica subsp. enterica serovar Typhi str. AG3]
MVRIRIRRPRNPFEGFEIPPIDPGAMLNPGGVIDPEGILNGIRNPGEAINHAKEELKKLDLNLSDADFNVAVNMASSHAQAYHEENKENGSFCDCVDVTAAACAAAGAGIGAAVAGGPTGGAAAIAGAAVGAALGAGAGYPMGRLVCENWYERTPCE